jgi:hypothetical protein
MTKTKVKAHKTVNAESQSLKPLSPTTVAPFRSFATPLKPLSPSLKTFYVSDQPVEDSEPEGDQKPKGSPQGFRQSVQHHRRSPSGRFAQTPAGRLTLTVCREDLDRFATREI